MRFTMTLRRGLTLVELLAVIAIIGLLVALLVPAVQSAREAARRIQCGNNLDQIGLALLEHEQFKNQFPPGRLGCDPGATYWPCNGSQTQWGTSFLVFLLPYLDQQALFDQMSLDKDGVWKFGTSGVESTWTTQPGVAAAVALQPPVYRCSSDPYPIFSEVGYGMPIPVAVGSYAGSMGSNGVSSDGSGVTEKVKTRNTGIFMYARTFQAAHVRDGLSQTFFVGEVIEPHTEAGGNIWTFAGRLVDSLRVTENPLNTPPGMGTRVKVNTVFANGAFNSRHPGGAQFVFGDGHSAFLNENISLATYRALSTRAGGEAITDGTTY